jgi:hypothetical protein
MKQPTGIEKKHYKENFDKNTADHYNTEGQNKQDKVKNKIVDVQEITRTEKKPTRMERVDIDDRKKNLIRIQRIIITEIIRIGRARIEKNRRIKRVDVQEIKRTEKDDKNGKNQ